MVPVAGTPGRGGVPRQARQSEDGDQNPGGNPQLGWFEPWDQSRFDPSEPAIGRVQWRNAYRSFRANLAHFQHNIGV